MQLISSFNKLLENLETGTPHANHGLRITIDMLQAHLYHCDASMQDLWYHLQKLRSMTIVLKKPQALFRPGMSVMSAPIPGEPPLPALRYPTP